MRALANVPQLVGALSLHRELQVQFPGRHASRLQVQSQVGEHAEGNQSMSPRPLSPLSFLALKSGKI